MSIKGTKTEQCLMKAFAGESQARNRYTLFSMKAADDGYMQISDIFLKIAEQEKEHAELFADFFEGSEVEITATFPAFFPDTKTTTVKNLQAAIAGEHDEWTKLYHEFAEIAKIEGFNDVSERFTKIASIERTHNRIFKNILDCLQKDEVFKSKHDETWCCAKCGYDVYGKESPSECPNCGEKGYYYMYGREF